MPASQLNRLKASLRESGVTGPQKSKKQKRKDAKDRDRHNDAATRAARLNSIRKQYNPFEIKTTSRRPKHEVATTGKTRPAVQGRPGITKGLGEELRRKKLLVEMQQRNRVGGIMDRRFGENDPSMTPEERALQRFVKENQRIVRKKTGVFDLEDEDGAGGGLTHNGLALSTPTGARANDLDEAVDGASDEEELDEQATKRASKRRKLIDEMDDLADREVEHGDHAKPKSRHEVMEEVIAKSKLHKYERQQAKEQDEVLREELDAELKDIYALIRGQKPAQTTQPTEATINADRAALLAGRDREQLDKEYDQRLRQLAQDARGMPTSRTKTEDEIAEEEAQRLRKLEQERLRRMRGEDVSEDEKERMGSDISRPGGKVDEEDEDEFGLGSGIRRQQPRKQIDVEDEDEFFLDENLIASGSEADLASSEDESDKRTPESGSEVEDDTIDDEAEFVEGLLTADDAGRKDLQVQPGFNKSELHERADGGLAFTYPCPSTHQEFLQIIDGIEEMQVITVIQRIRALYHPKLNGKNRAKLGAFAAVLVDHISHLSRKETAASFCVIEQLIRHIHSLAKAYPIEVANAFRNHLVLMSGKRSRALNAGDLVLFTAIGDIFSTSDHFHQVVTPAMLCMACYLGQSVPNTLADLVTGAYLCTQFLRYQRLSKRYVPEVLNYVVSALAALAPLASAKPFGQTPQRDSDPALRASYPQEAGRKLKFWDVNFNEPPQSPDGETLKQALLATFIQLIDIMAELWHGKSAFIEMFTPLASALNHLNNKSCTSKLLPATSTMLKSTCSKVLRLLSQAGIDRRPLALHHHRPLPIKTSIPKFEESFRPDKHYDPDRERAELSKLRKEHKRERKGALRELRKDANFVARETLRQKKEADAVYEKKYKRLVAEIQGEEAHEAKQYDREKKLRHGKK